MHAQECAESSKAHRMTRISSQLPYGLTCYRRTVEFTRETVPAALLRAHSTKAGVWGLLNVRRGRVRYYLEGAAPETTVVEHGGTVVIEPQQLHHVELLDGDSAFFVEFYRAEEAA